MGCTACSKNKSYGTYNLKKTATKSPKYGTTKPSGGQGKTSAKPVAGFGGYSTKSSPSYASVKQSAHSGRTPISHASSGRGRRH